MGQRTGRQSVYSFAIIFLCPERPSGPGVVVFQAGERGREEEVAGVSRRRGCLWTGWWPAWFPREAQGRANQFNGSKSTSDGE